MFTKITGEAARFPPIILPPHMTRLTAHKNSGVYIYDQTSGTGLVSTEQSKQMEPGTEQRNKIILILSG